MRRALVILVLLLLCLAGAGYALFAASEREAGGLVEAEVGGARLYYPSAYARDEPSANGGLSDRLALAALFPDFRAPQSPGAAQGPARSMVFLTLTAKDEGADPAERPAKLYARFLDGDAFDGPSGLILRRFEAGSPYDLELLYLSPPDGRGFFARCPRPQPGASSAKDQCLTLFRDGGLDVELRYDPALLEQWETLIDGARAFLRGLTATPRPAPAGKAG